MPVPVSLPSEMAGDPLGLHRVLRPRGVLPQAADQLDTRRDLWPDELRVRVERLNLDAASYRQLARKHAGNGAAVRAEVLATIRRRGKMHNPVTGSGGMLVGTVEEVGAQSPLGLSAGDRIATLVSLTLTPLVIEDDLAGWDGNSEQVPAGGYAILFGRSIAARLPDDLPTELALAVMDVCGAPALTARLVRQHMSSAAPATGSTATPATGPTVAVLGGAGKSGSLSLAAAKRAGAARAVAVVPSSIEAELLAEADVADAVTVADARDPVALSAAVRRAGGPADVTVVCVDVPGCEGGAVLATREGGTVAFFSMATSFSAAALGAEGLAADVTMLIGNGYLPGHAEYALSLVRGHAGVRRLFDRRLAEARSTAGTVSGPAPGRGE